GGPAPGSVISGGDCPPPWFHPDQLHHGGHSAVVTVGAVDNDDVVASFSGRGPVTWWNDYSDTSPLVDPDICGPGTDIVSTAVGGGYFSMSGTSSATSHLAGVAALMLDANPYLTVAQLDSLMETTAVELGPSGKDNSYGAGRIDALAAVDGALEVGIANSEGHTINDDPILSRIVPNPANTYIAFDLYCPEPAPAELTVFDTCGRRIANIASPMMDNGTRSFYWAVPEDIGNGIYFLRASFDGRSLTESFTLVR
ncbi:MAG: S8 family serine peptidase, partial [Candidatus Aegiribacteria sp.]|nr:S8 family serine peptidase [Candidatus Aegiribacteria sp.]MBD3294448.1 S8 family serine peptidase [Candidatus Fermentibacteria bacterium]